MARLFFMQFPIIEILLLTIATWRIAYMFVYENGPYDIFEKLRNLLDTMQNTHATMLIDLLGCLYCTSFWVGVFFTTVYICNSTVAFCIALPFVLSAFAIFIDMIHDRLAIND